MRWGGSLSTFSPCGAISGFAEQTQSGRLAAQMVACGFGLATGWASAVCAAAMAAGANPARRRPLTSHGGGNFDRPNGPIVVNSVRLTVPELDLYTWGDRPTKAGAPHADAYVWSGRNSLRGEVIPEDDPPNSAPEPSTAQPSRRRGRCRLPYRRDRRRRSRYCPRPSGYSPCFRLCAFG